MAGNKNSGGRRVGSGRKRKSESQKMEEEQGRMTMTFDSLDEDVPKPNRVLREIQLEGNPLQADEIYEKTWVWLEKRGCTPFVSPELLDRYAMMFARWLHCEEHISKLGYLGKHPTTGGEIQSPYVKMSHDYMSQVNRLWLEIFSIVKEHCTGDFGSGNTLDPMEMILGGG